MTRQAAAYREGRVLLAGDAAHVHPPVGGQGLNTGVQDAVNLGWKLAQVVKRTSPDSLLDTYHAERHPVGARVLRNTMAQVALTPRRRPHRGAARHRGRALGMDEPRKRFAAMMSGLDIHYDLGEGHPLLGRRMPDLDLVTANGPLRVFTLLHDARPVLLNLGEPGGFDITPWADRVQLVDAEYDGAWELPVLGAVALPRRVDPARRIRGLGGRWNAAGARRRADDLVRTVTAHASYRSESRKKRGALTSRIDGAEHGQDRSGDHRRRRGLVGLHANHQVENEDARCPNGQQPHRPPRPSPVLPKGEDQHGGEKQSRSKSG